MSLAEVERFSKDLKTDPDLLADAGESRLAAAVEIAAQRGYSFTLDDARAFIRNRIKLPGRELSDAELDRVVGGLDSHRNGVDSENGMALP